MRFFDSHCHIDDKAYTGDLDIVLQHMKENHVEHAIVVGINQARSAQVVKLAEKYDEFFASVGIHPHVTSNCSISTLNFLKELTQNKNVCAWGEIGLDFNRMASPRPIQEKWFIAQMEAAQELDLPIIFHERDTRGRFREIIQQHLRPNHPGIVHCFSGSYQDLCAYIDLGLYIGLSGIITQDDRVKKLQKLIHTIPVESILIETDAPYLIPFPDNLISKRNEPAFVTSVFKKLVEIKNCDPYELSEQIWMNTFRVFNFEEKQL